VDESQIQANEAENRSRFSAGQALLIHVNIDPVPARHSGVVTQTIRRVLIIQGHPDPAGARLCHALAHAYARGAEAGGHPVEVIETAMLDLPLLRSQADFEAGPAPAGVPAAQDAIRRAQHLVIVFPLWLGTMPALLKAFFEQVLRPGFGFAYQSGGGIDKLLAGRSARIVVTMGMPAWLYRWFYLGHGVRVLSRSILALCGVAPVRISLYGPVDSVRPATRQGWLKEMEMLGRDAA